MERDRGPLRGRPQGGSGRRLHRGVACKLSRAGRTEAIQHLPRGTDVLDMGRVRPLLREFLPRWHVRPRVATLVLAPARTYHIAYGCGPRIPCCRTRAFFAVGVTALVLAGPRLAASQPRTLENSDHTVLRHPQTDRAGFREGSSHPRKNAQPTHAAPQGPAGKPLHDTRPTPLPGRDRAEATPVLDRPARVPDSLEANRSKRPDVVKRRRASKLRSPAVPKERPFLFEVPMDGGPRELARDAGWS